MNRCTRNKGFTIIELMVVVGIVAVLASFAYPAYVGYIDAGCISTAKTNLKTLQSFEENYQIENHTYLAGTHNAGDASSVLTTGLHWTPDDDDRYTYTVGPGSTGSIKTSLSITVSAPNCSVDATGGN